MTVAAETQATRPDGRRESYEAGYAPAVIASAFARWKARRSRDRA